MRFIKAVSSADIYSLGTILLQAGTGCPNQLDMPARLKCYTTNNKMFTGTPHFGYCVDGRVDNTYASQTVKQ